MSQVTAKNRLSRLFSVRDCESQTAENIPVDELRMSCIWNSRAGAKRPIWEYVRYKVSKKLDSPTRYDRLIEIANKAAADSRPSDKILKLIEQFKIEIEFQKLAEKWESETRNISSPKKIAQHPSVQDIVAMGESVIPLIMRRIRHRPWFWFHALMQLAKPDVNPITPAMRGDMERMTDAWLKWGARHGYV